MSFVGGCGDWADEEECQSEQPETTYLSDGIKVCMAF